MQKQVVKMITCFWYKDSQQSSPFHLVDSLGIIVDVTVG